MTITTVDPDQVEGIVDSITYYDASSPFTVAKVRSAQGMLTVVGEMEAPRLGGRFRFVGQWVEHAEYGRQLSTHWYEEALPTTAAGIERYLSSGIVKGVGKKMASRIVNHFGEDTLRVIDEEPARLAEVPRLTDGVRAQLVATLVEHRATRTVMTFLASCGVTPALAGKIYRTYGARSVELVQQNPYRMADDIWGVGFKIADSVARSLGRQRHDPFRLEAGLMHLLSDAQEQGHLYLPQDDLLARAGPLLEMETTSLEEPLLRLRASGRVMADETDIYLRVNYHLELKIARLVRQRCGLPGRAAPTDEQMAQVEARLGMQLGALQKVCLRRSLSEGAFIMTGGPGTGKTTTVRAILEWCRQQQLSVLLAAPTGRAARRLSEATAADARTLHRHLEFSPQERRFKRDEDNRLAADVVIVDEVSMVDVYLFAALLDALPPRAHLVLVGDVDQLPSVGPGCVLRDLIASERIPVIFLNEIFRQAEGSLIVTNAHRINAGEFPQKGNAQGDFFFMAEDDVARVAETIVSLCAQRLPAHYGFDAVRDIQVISPMYRGEAGVTALNQALQQRLNRGDGGDEVTVSNGKARVGDKVMQMRNNYDKGVFNGDMGIICALDAQQKTLRVRLLGGGEEVEYDFGDGNELSLAYAVSVHKSQGSEFPAVVIPMVTQHYVMLQRNLLYTAVTRARRLAVLVGSPRAMSIAIRNASVEKRYTKLAARLREED